MGQIYQFETLKYLPVLNDTFSLYIYIYIFVDILTDSSYNDKFITSLYKKSTCYNFPLIKYYNECPPKI